MVYIFAYILTSLLNWLFFTCRVSGRENLPAEDGYILASNHLSNIDPFILGFTIGRRCNFLAKESLVKNKISSWFFRSLGVIPIKRDTSDFRAIREAIKQLKKGTPLIVFPEGTRGASDRKKEPQPGIALIAVKSGVPIIPVRIEGSDKALPPHSMRFYRYPVKITIGKPLQFSKAQSYPQIANQIMDKIYSPVLMK